VWIHYEYELYYDYYINVRAMMRLAGRLRNPAEHTTLTLTTNDDGPNHDRNLSFLRDIVYVFCFMSVFDRRRVLQCVQCLNFLEFRITSQWVTIILWFMNQCHIKKHLGDHNAHSTHNFFKAIGILIKHYLK